MKNRFFTYFAFALCAVFALPAVADPVAGYGQTAPVATSTSTASPRASASPRSGRASAASTKAGATVTTRNVTSRGTATRGVTTQPKQNIVSRANTARTASSRAVRARTGVTDATKSRVSLTGAAIRATSSSSVYSSTLASRLYTGTYSNIIDPTTGLISADAYSNCMESYYACMDEICTARNPGQRRCACAGRVKTFANVESQLQEAKEDLLKVTGQLTLLIATKGKDVTDAFTLTDAEKVLNCVSWRDAVTSETEDEWCETHTLLAGTTSCTSYSETPAFVAEYCSSDEFGWGTGDDWLDFLNGSDSDILTNLETYASTINQVNVITSDNTDSLWSSYMNVSDIVGELSGTGTIYATDTTTDTLAQMWGYDLFEYAHNNVCNRVLDSCFNGIYEACGSHDGTTGPYNYNSDISVSSDNLEFIEASAITTSTATCFGYSSTSGDPYSTLRKPVADARRSILQKYALDANADCDTYGEELKTQATNMAYQKIAATQYLQQKRLEFAQEEADALETELTAAKSSLLSCVSEVYDCLLQEYTINPTWTTVRIRSYCSQSAEVPSCYETMVANQEAGAIIDLADSPTCNTSLDWELNTCRNITSLSEIFYGTGAADVDITEDSSDSEGLREWHLRNTLGIYGDGGIRDFGTGWGTPVR